MEACVFDRTLFVYVVAITDRSNFDSAGRVVEPAATQLLRRIRLLRKTQYT
jgi:hypothetical protein